MYIDILNTLLFRSSWGRKRCYGIHKVSGQKRRASRTNWIECNGPWRRHGWAIPATQPNTLQRHCWQKQQAGELCNQTPEPRKLSSSRGSRFRLCTNAGPSSSTPARHWYTVWIVNPRPQSDPCKSRRDRQTTARGAARSNLVNSNGWSIAQISRQRVQKGELGIAAGIRLHRVAGWRRDGVRTVKDQIFYARCPAKDPMAQSSVPAWQTAPDDGWLSSCIA